MDDIYGGICSMCGRELINCVCDAAQKQEEAVVTVAQQPQDEICPHCKGNGGVVGVIGELIDICKQCKGTGKRSPVR
jgi:DnaJ-class molecular chaperone